MAWGDLKPDTWYRLPGGLIIREYYLKNHEKTTPPKRPGAVQGITITTVPVLMKYDDSAEYIKQLTPDGFIPHIFDGMRDTWQILDLDCCWQRADGRANDKTICIAVICSSGTMPFRTPSGEFAPVERSYTPFHDAAKLTANLLHKNKLPLSSVKVTKDCSDFITTRWIQFKTEIKKQLARL